MWAAFSLVYFTCLNTEMHKGKIKLRDKLVGLRRLKKMGSAKSRGARIDGSDPAEQRGAGIDGSDGAEPRGAGIDGSDQAEPSNARYNLPGSAEVNRAREALDKSTMELRAAVNDPLPEALRIAEAIAKLQKEAERNNGGPENVSKPSLMERNSTARTFEVTIFFLFRLLLFLT